MKKNALLTFVFACIPGAGQMYYGYMLRGLSLISLFCGCLMVSLMISDALVLTAAIVWMYSFFDTYDIIRAAAAGEPKKDGLLIVGDAENLKKVIPQNGKLLGWILIALGAWSLYDVLIKDWLGYLLYAVLEYEAAWRVLHDIPTLVVAVLLIMGGMWLLGLRPAPKQAPPSELPPYPHQPEDPQK